MSLEVWKSEGPDPGGTNAVLVHVTTSSEQMYWGWFEEICIDQSLQET